MKFSPTPFSVKELLTQAQEGRLGLPEFQRTFIWKPRDVADFLRTVARDWPAGSLLLLEGPQDFACKQIESAPALAKEPSLLILDGQQRMTALYQALLDQADEVYYVDMKPLLLGEAFEDEHLKFEPKTKFAKRHPSVQRMAAEKVIPVHHLCEDTDFLRWTRYLDEQEQELAFSVRDSQLSGFKAYFLPSVVLPRQTPLSALAKIFETINRTGVRLNVFDLMVAKLYPREFHLRDKWAEALETYPSLGKFDVDGIEVLKLIALEEHLRQHAAPKPADGSKPPLTVKGVRESDVLCLDLQVVLDRWTWALKSYAKALEFIESRCGVLGPALVPSTTMLLPLADSVGAEDGARPNFETDLDRWYWTSVFGQVFAQGANTQAVADAKALRAWRVDAAAVPASVATFELDKSILEDQRRRNEIFVAGVAGLLVKRNARDWLRPAGNLAQADTQLDIHHIYAKKYLRNLGIQESDVVANLTVVRSSTNQSLRNDPPAVVAQRTDLERSAVESHAIDFDRFQAGKWTEFLDDRRDRLAVMIGEVTK